METAISQRDLDVPQLDLDALTWTDGAVDVGDFYNTHDLPQIVKVDSGDYGNFGTGTHVDVQRPFLLYASRRCSKVLAANVYWDDSKQDYVGVGPRIVIPVNYPGWFYFLQDSGKVGQTMGTVEEVCRAQPKAILVRKSVPCYRYTQRGAAPNDRVYINEEVHPGEMLRVGDTFTETLSKSKSSCCLLWMVGRNHRKQEVRYLQSQDMRGREVLLEMSQEGEFSPVGEAGSSYEDSVYQLNDVVRHLQVPILMKLALGQPPATQCSFTGLLRLEEVYFEETIVACIIGSKSPMMVEFPTDSEIQFIVCTNSHEFMDDPAVRRTLEHCDNHIDTYVTSIKVVQNFYPDHIKVEQQVSLKERILPPIPAFTVDSNASEAGSDESMTSGEFTEIEESDDDIPDYEVEPPTALDEEIDATYEEIPGDKQRHLNPAYGHRMLRAFEDEEGYLVPVRSLKCLPELTEQKHQASSSTSNSPVKYTELKSHKAHKPSQLEHHVLSRQNAVFMDSPNGSGTPQNERANNDQDSVVSGQKGTEIVEKHLQERLDKFLTDSLQELHRLQSEGSTPISTLERRHSTGKGVHKKPDNNAKDPNSVLETNEEVDAFLEKIFDYEAMSAENRNSPRRQVKRLSSLTETDRKAIQLRPNTLEVDHSSWNGSFRQKPPPLRCAYSNPDATVNNHNFRNMSMDTLRARRRDQYGENDASPIKERSRSFVNPSTSMEHVDVSRSTFQPVQTLGSDLSPHMMESTTDSAAGSSICTKARGSTPSPDQDISDRTTTLTDSGIFLSPRWSDYNLECESPYRSPSEDSWYPPDDVTTMSVDEVAHSLRFIGMKDRIIMRFLEEQIDGKQLKDLDDLLLREGFPELNALERKKVVDFAKGWRPKRSSVF